jgi:D-glycero-D-manno-heptose 1,7-bisphosphate phosphatase
LPEIDDILCCYHDDADRCVCRKPGAGMLIEAARRYGLDLRHSFMIGDSWRDTEAGHRAGCTTLQIRSLVPPVKATVAPDLWVTDLADATRMVLASPLTVDRIAPAILHSGRHQEEKAL